jgi:hypothetical protein
MNSMEEKSPLRNTVTVVALIFKKLAIFYGAQKFIMVNFMFEYPCILDKQIMARPIRCNK